MSELRFTVLDIAPERYAVSPTLLARVRVEESTGAAVHALALRAQVRIEPARRRYSGAEEDGLLDLFGRRERWGDTQRPFLWMHTTALVPGFTAATDVDLPLPCTYDVDVAGSKYLQALGDGDVPLLLLFSGTVFTRGESGFAVEQVPWDREAAYRLPVRVWRAAMDACFPGSQWVRLDRDTVDALARYRAAGGFLDWDSAVLRLLDAAVLPGGVSP